MLRLKRIKKAFYFFLYILVICMENFMLPNNSYINPIKKNPLMLYFKLSHTVLVNFTNLPIEFRTQVRYL